MNVYLDMFQKSHYKKTEKNAKLFAVTLKM